MNIKLFLFIVFSCFYGLYYLYYTPNKKFKIEGNEFVVYYVNNDYQAQKGLGNVDESMMNDNMVLFFPGKKLDEKHFWNNNMLFDFDIYFLDHQCVIIGFKHEVSKFENEIVHIKKLGVHVFETKSNKKLQKIFNIGKKLPFCERTL